MDEEEYQKASSGLLRLLDIRILGSQGHIVGRGKVGMGEEKLRANGKALDFPRSDFPSPHYLLLGLQGHRNT